MKISEAVRILIRGGKLGRETKLLPKLNILLVIDILSVLDSLGPLRFGRLLQNLRTFRKHNTLSKYLDALTEFGFVGKRSTPYRGAVKQQSTYSITEKGKGLIAFLE